jgi:hypothetical protein
MTCPTGLTIFQIKRPFISQKSHGNTGQGRENMDFAQNGIETEIISSCSTALFLRNVSLEEVDPYLQEASTSHHAYASVHKGQSIPQKLNNWNSLGE